ncbi:AAA family ATPase [Candidatus Gracilibacteria bacterium]|nr:AAA family ATPase [Candidatus Gracilibacteria bacterium]
MNNHFLKTIYFDNTNLQEKYIENIDIFKDISELELEEKITYFVGENGTGKSTLLESIAESFGFNKEGGTINSNYKTNKTDNIENNWIKLSWQPTRFKSGYFFRAEGIYNFVNYLEQVQDGFSPYGGENLHKFSHGQQFMKIFESMIDRVGFYILDEIESALSPANQLKVVEIIKYMVSNGSQFLIATHSPIILSIKQDSQILSFDYGKISKIDYDMVPCVDMYKRILLK